MDKRSEPRFQIRSAINIAAIDHPELVCEAMLLDVSGAGLKIVADNWWPLETRIVVELENHLVVARVRNIVARGPKFSLGAERLYSVLKHTLPAGVSRTVWHNLLRAEMRDLPVVPERAAAEPVEPLEMAPPEMEVPTVRSSEIAEREGAARKITLRTSEPPQALRAAEPSGDSIEESEALNPQPQSMGSPSAALPSEQLSEQPAVARAAIEHIGVEQQAAVEQTPVEQTAVEQFPVKEPGQEEPLVQHAVEQVAVEQVMETAGEAMIAEPKPIASEIEPQVANVIPEVRCDALAASYQRPAPVEALPSETRPQALSTLREALVPVASDTVSSQPPASTAERNTITVVPQAAEPVALVQLEAISPATPVAERTLPPPQNSLRTQTSAQQPSHPTEDAPGRTPRGTMQERVSRPAANSKTLADPPMARAFPLVPNVANPCVLVATLPLTPKFGPAYGMAPTADGLMPISTMPEVVTIPEAKPSWVISSAVVAAVIGILTLAFYYGPFRPKAASAPRLQTAQHVEAPLTIPAVTEGPSAATNAAAIPAAASASQQTGQTQTGTSQPGIKPVPVQMAKVSPPASPTQTAVQAAAPVQAVPAKASPVANSAPTVSTSTNLTPTVSAPPVSTTTRRVTVKAASLLWFSDCSDGKPAIQKVLQTGDSVDIEFHQMTVFKLGNAAAAQMTLDGKPLGALGAPGAVKIVELTAAGLRELPPTTAAGAECQPMRASAKP